MASYTRLWPAVGTQATLFLKELFVRPTARRRGIARALMDELADLAVLLGCARLEWTADHDNPTALDFYHSLGAKPHTGKIYYRVEL